MESKLIEHFGTLVVNKREVREAKVGPTLGMPGYVIEFILGAARKKNKEISFQKVLERIKPFLVDPDQSRGFLGSFMQEGKAQLVSFLSVNPIVAKNEFIGELPGFKEKFFVSAGLLAKYPDLLNSGLWGKVELVYDNNKPIINDFHPYQLSNPNLNLFKSAKEIFSTQDWVDVLIETLGYRSSALTSRQKLLFLVRLVPLVQGNVNLVELGPRGTAKSYTLRNISHRVSLISGAKVTAASLIYNNQTRTNGSLLQKSVIVFDEIAGTEFNDMALISALKDYMEEGTVTRMSQGRQVSSTCSLYFAGNIDLNRDGTSPHPNYKTLFDVLPDEMQDTALWDRFHGLVPGWELPKIREDMLSEGVGLLSDYFGAVLSDSDKTGYSLRRDHFHDQWLVQNIKLTSQESPVTLRDQKAIFKIAAGLLKMIFPNGDIKEVNDILNLAVELRQNVVDQMTKDSPGEFPKKNIRWEMKNNGQKFNSSTI